MVCPRLWPRFGPYYLFLSAVGLATRSFAIELTTLYTNDDRAYNSIANSQDVAQADVLNRQKEQANSIVKDWNQERINTDFMKRVMGRIDDRTNMLKRALQMRRRRVVYSRRRRVAVSSSGTTLNGAFVSIPAPAVQPTVVKSKHTAAARADLRRLKILRNRYELGVRKAVKRNDDRQHYPPSMSHKSDGENQMQSGRSSRTHGGYTWRDRERDELHERERQRMHRKRTSDRSSDTMQRRARELQREGSSYAELGRMQVGPPPPEQTVALNTDLDSILDTAKEVVEGSASS